MTISYPLALPTVTGFAQVELRAINAVARGQSPFTFASQVYRYPGQMWQADVSLPPMSRERAEVWIGWILSLEGQFGNFLLGDPLGKIPRGVAAQFPGTPLVKGDGQTGQTLNIDGASAGKTGWLKAGDYIQIGAGASARLHKALQDVNTDETGNATLSLWPRVRIAPADNTPITLSNPQGVFRLSSNEQAWSINEASIYGVTFGAEEVI